MIAVGHSCASVISLNSSTNRLGPLRSATRTANASSRMPPRTSELRVREDILVSLIPPRHPRPARSGARSFSGGKGFQKDTFYVRLLADSDEGFGDMHR